jgi:hypothetical protein
LLIWIVKLGWLVFVRDRLFHVAAGLACACELRTLGAWVALRLWSSDRCVVYLNGLSRETLL